jgi:cellulose biosynthesis protein BcsQ
VLPTFWDGRTNESEANLRDLAEHYGRLVLPAVPRCTNLREAPAHGLTIWEYPVGNRAVRVAYERLTARVCYGQ